MLASTGPPFAVCPDEQDILFGARFAKKMVSTICRAFVILSSRKGHSTEIQDATTSQTLFAAHAVRACGALRCKREMRRLSAGSGADTKMIVADIRLL